MNANPRWNRLAVQILLLICVFLISIISSAHPGALWATGSPRAKRAQNPFPNLTATPTSENELFLPRAANGEAPANVTPTATPTTGPILGRDPNLYLPLIADQSGAPSATPTTSPPPTPTLPPFAQIASSSPHHGEVNVSVTRKTILHFDRPLHALARVDRAVEAIANGEPLSVRTRLSADGRRLFIFFNDSLPGSTRVEISLDGTALADSAGNRLDADGDGSPGGTYTISFDTLSLVRIPETDVWGYVYDSYNRNPDGSNRPIVGATIRVDAFPEARATTDANGYFLLEDMPAPVFFVHVDGSTATNPPPGWSYPSVGKPFHSVPGRSVQIEMDGDPFDIYLPPMSQTDVQPLDGASDTAVGFGAEGQAALETMQPGVDPSLWAQMQVTFPAGSAQSDDGSTATQGLVIPVDPQRLPAPLPASRNPALVVSIQAPGATLFDVPAPVRFPNLLGRPPGARSSIFSFDHDAGEWVSIGGATVSADGLAVVSDPGVGILAPGWHWELPVTTPTGPGSGESGQPCVPGGSDEAKEPVEPIIEAFTGGTSSLNDQLFFADGDGFVMTFANKAERIKPAEDPCSDANRKATRLRVVIKFDGWDLQFLESTSIPSGGEHSFELLPEQEPMQISLEALDLLNPDEIRMAESNVLYGTKIEFEFYEVGTRGPVLMLEDEIYVYRLFDIADAAHEDGLIDFERTFVDGSSGVRLDKPFELAMPESVKPGFSLESGEHFVVDDATLRFDPSTDGPALTDVLRLANPEGDAVGEIQVRGNGAEPQRILISRQGMRDRVCSILDSSDSSPSLSNIFPADSNGNNRQCDEPGFDATLVEIYTYFVDQLRSTVFAGIDPLAPSTIALLDSAGGSGIHVTFHESDPQVADTIADGGYDAGVTGAAVDVASGPFVSVGFDVRDIEPGTEIKMTIELSLDGVSWVPVESHLFSEDRVLRINYERASARAFRVVSQHQSAGGTPGSAHYHVIIVSHENPCPNPDTPACAWWADFNRIQFQQYAEPAEVEKMSVAERAFRLSGITNRSYSDNAGGRDKTVQIVLDVQAARADRGDLEKFKNGLTNGMGHEIGHALGAIHLRSLTEEYVWGSGESHNDIMGSAGSGHFHVYTFRRLAPLMKLALGLPLEDGELERIWTYYDTYVGLEDYRFNQSAAARSHGPEPEEEIGALLVPFDRAPVPGGTLPELVGAIDFGTVLVDGAGGELAEQTLFLVNDGGRPLRIESAAILNATVDIALQGGDGLPIDLNGIDLEAPTADASMHVLTLRFDPTRTGAFDFTLRIESDSVGRNPIEIPISGRGIAPGGDITVVLDNNNLGGLRLSNPPRIRSGAFSIRNDGAGPLTISAIEIVAGDLPQFALIGAAPLTLDPGASHPVDVQFDAAAIGLQRSVVRISSDDPDSPVLDQTVIGTGLPDSGSALDYGDDYVVIEAQGSNRPLRTRSNRVGDFTFAMPLGTPFEAIVFDPVSGLIWRVRDLTSPIGAPTGLGFPAFFASSTRDSDGDGLPDDAEFAIGTRIDNVDTDRDGLDDFAEILQGFNPLDGLEASGTVAGVALKGNAKAIVLQNETAYLATGTFGLALVDISRPDRPVVITQMDLAGDGVDVAVDPLLPVVAVASGAGGLHLIDINDPFRPTLIRTVDVQALQTMIVDGVVYAADESRLHAVDPLTGDILQSLDLPGSGPVSGISHDRDHLALFRQGSRSLLIYDVQIEGNARLVGQLDAINIAADVSLFAADNHIFMAAAGAGGPTGMAVVDITDPTAPALIGAPGGTTGATAIALNGSGLALLTQEGLNDFALFDVSDPRATTLRIEERGILGQGLDLAIGNGLAFVAGAEFGLVVVRYLPSDRGGVPPTLSLNAAFADIDPEPGLQVVEGSTLPLFATVSDDVQVARVELLLDGRVVAIDSAYPWSFRAVAPSIAAAGPSITLQARTMDTGGNSALSPPLTLELVPDTVAPTLLGTDPGDGATLPAGHRRVALIFSEPLDLATVSDGTFQLQTPGRRIVTPQNVQTRSGDRVVQLTYAPLPSGRYEILVDGSVSDRVGNRLGGDPLRAGFILEAVERGEILFEQPLFSHPLNPGPLAAADLNDDGIPDLVTVGAVGFSGRYELATLLGNANTLLSEAAATLITEDENTRPFALRVIDVTSDGSEDAVVLREGAFPNGTLSVYPNLGDGVFGAAIDTVVPLASTLAVADLNRDGRLDLVLGLIAGQGVGIVLGNGDGTFSDSGRLDGSSPDGVALADVNGDGNLDLLVLRRTVVQIYAGDGSGAFADPVDYEIGGEAHGIEMADLNRDSRKDMVLIQTNFFGPSQVLVALADGTGGFPAPSEHAVGQGAEIVEIADLDQNRAPDLVTGNDESISVLLNRGDGTFEVRPLISVLDSFAELALTDLSGDGAPDIMLSQSGAVQVLVNSGIGGFRTQQALALGDRQRGSLLAADLNGDARPELVSVRDGNFGEPDGVSVLDNNGVGGFSLLSEFDLDFSTRNNERNGALADFSGDGIADLAIVNVSANRISLLAGDGSSGFGAPVHFTYAVNRAPERLVAGDLNGDGLSDLIVFHTSSSASILLADGAGNLVDGGTAPVGLQAADLVVHDLDGDGDPDLLVLAGETVRTLLRNPEGGYDVGPEVALVSSGDAIFLGNLNNDGAVDAFVASEDQEIFTLLGNGDGSFGAPARFILDGSAGGSRTLLGVGDVDGDGRSDVLAAGSSDRALFVLTGTADGSLRTGGLYRVKEQPAALVAADLNGDGRIDFATLSDGLDDFVTVGLSRGE